MCHTLYSTLRAISDSNHSSCLQEAQSTGKDEHVRNSDGFISVVRKLRGHRGEWSQVSTGQGQVSTGQGQLSQESQSTQANSSVTQGQNPDADLTGSPGCFNLFS